MGLGLVKRLKKKMGLKQEIRLTETRPIAFACRDFMSDEGHNFFCIRPSHLLQYFQDPVDDGFGLGWATRHMGTNGHVLVERPHDIVAVVVHAARYRAGAYRNDGFRLGHLLINTDEPVLGLPRHGAGDD